MIPVEQALQTILENTQDFGTDTSVEEVPYIESVGRVLKEDIIADRDFPPFNRVAMDGIAINHRFFEHGVRAFKIEGIQPAGSPQQTLENAAHCYEVMTGAVLPENTDTVIRYEDVTIETLMATVNVEEIVKGKNIHTQGQDRQLGDVLIPQNRVITAAEIGVIASVGKTHVKVAKVPKVMIVSTGDELVEVDQTPEAHQIRRSNSFTLVSLLKRFHIHAETDHIVDDKQKLKEKIASHLENYDALIFSGAVSKGKFDFLPEVLDELGVEKLFHRVAQRPGKPFWYGTRNGKSIFAFPGNPVSTYVNCLVYFYPWYAKSTGFELKEETVILGDDVTFKPDLTYFLQVKIDIKYGHLVAMPVKANGSGDLVSLVDADGFIQLPKGQTDFEKGSTYQFLRYRTS
jgi:molybdopterin molybdotransferase